MFRKLPLFLLGAIQSHGNFTVEGEQPGSILHPIG